MSADETSHEPSAAPAGPSAAPPTAPAASVSRERRDDPLTGLPVLRYRFPGPPTLRPGDPSPAGAWRVLRADSRDGSTTLDLETHAGAASLADHAADIDDAAAAVALAALADARALGVAHGDLGAHRLWRRGDQTWIEGYGVPWREGATAEADARALATDLLAIAGTALGATMRERLAAVRDGDDPAAGPPSVAAAPVPPHPGPPPDATTPAPQPRSDAAASPRPAGPAVDAPPAPPAVDAPPAPSTPPAADAPPAPSAPPAADAPSAQVGPRLVRGPPPGATLRPGATHAWQRTVRDARDAGRAAATAAGVVAEAGAAGAIRLVRRGGRSTAPTPRDVATRGATPDHEADAPLHPAGGGARPPSGVTRRHALMGLALVVSAGVWLGLASWSPPVPAAAIFVSRVVGHVVDVRIEPAGLPPVGLVVVESPAGSRLPPGTVVGSVPSKVLLDRDGVWRFQARFGGTSSRVVVLVAPDEAVLVVPFPSPPPATAP